MVAIHLHHCEICGTHRTANVCDECGRTACQMCSHPTLDDGGDLIWVCSYCKARESAPSLWPGLVLLGFALACGAIYWLTR